ncbi:MAG: Purine-binding protein [Anaerolineales bacterium]|nr:Purine-binding protein [Anaerolineales bacterium]
MNRKVILILTGLLLIALVACAGAPVVQEAAPAEEEAPAVEESAGKMAVILTGPWDDNSWNEAGYDAIQAMGDKDVEITFSESVADADVERVLRQYAEDGFEMIVAHSFSYQDATFAVAEDYADVNFAWAGGIGRTAANVADYDQPFYEAAYPIGVLAGHMSETGVLGALYGFDIPVCHAMGEALLEGAKTVNADAKLIQTAVGDWVDVAKAKEAALAQADAGVDFWIECGEGPALGAIEAAKEAGGYVTGYVGNMNENGPDVVLVNLMWNLEPMFTQMLDDVHAGAFDNPYYRFGIAEDAMLLKYNDALKDQIPPEAIEAVDQTMADIAAGELEVSFVPE